MLKQACGYALASKGHDTRALQAYLGHRNISTPSARGLADRFGILGGRRRIGKKSSPHALTSNEARSPQECDVRQFEKRDSIYLTVLPLRGSDSWATVIDCWLQNCTDLACRRRKAIPIDPSKAGWLSRFSSCITQKPGLEPSPANLIFQAVSKLGRACREQ